MERKYSTEIVRRVSDDEDGVSITVERDPDGIGLVSIYPSDKASEDYYGVIRLTIHKDMARHLGRAILESCAE